MFRDEGLKQRRREADERREERKKRGDLAQLQKLEREGHGHCKEACRIRGRLEKEAKS